MRRVRPRTPQQHATRAPGAAVVAPTGRRIADTEAAPPLGHGEEAMAQRALWLPWRRDRPAAVAPEPVPRRRRRQTRFRRVARWRARGGPAGGHRARALPAAPPPQVDGAAPTDRPPTPSCAPGARRSRGWRSERCARPSRSPCSAPTSTAAAGARGPRAQPRQGDRGAEAGEARPAPRARAALGPERRAGASSCCWPRSSRRPSTRPALRLQQVEEETRAEAERRARNILSVAMHRLAAKHSSESTTRLVELPNDEMKGRIIGRDGRNIRALEKLTGVDVIIDETPSAVLLSSFDGVRREIARVTLERLIADGRIHPALIEETYEHARERDRRADRRGGREGGARGPRQRARPRAHCGCSASCASAPATARTSSTTWSSARSSRR